MQRLKNIICHPSRIGLYHKDDFYIVILYLVLFISFLIGFLALKTYNTTYFDSTDLDYVVSLVEKNKAESNIEYKDHKLNGNPYSVTDTLFECYFLSSTDINSIKNSGFIVFLRDDNYSIYYGYRLISSGKYENISTDYHFTITGIKNNVDSDVFSFKGMFDYLFKSANSGYATHVFLSNILSVFQYYFIFSILVLAVYSYFINPGIAMGKRAKLVLYDSMIYFLIMFFTLAFDFKYLQYGAIILPLVYCSFTFTHIIRLRK